MNTIAHSTVALIHEYDTEFEGGEFELNNLVHCSIEMLLSKACEFFPEDEKEECMIKSYAEFPFNEIHKAKPSQPPQKLN